MPFIRSVREAKIDTVGILLLKLITYTGKFDVEDN